MKVARVDVHRFPDGESLVRIRTAGVRKILSCDTVSSLTTAAVPRYLEQVRLD